MNRRLFLSSSSAVFAGASVSYWMHEIEPFRFVLTETEVPVRGIKPRRVLHLSDWHVSDGMGAPDLAKGLGLGLARKPDLICLTGDFVSTTSGFDEAGLSVLLRRCADSAPSFAVLGNHDGGEWLARIGGARNVDRLSEIVTRTGVRLLQNECAEASGMRIAGVGDFWSGYFHPERAFAGAPGDGHFTLLLNHNPDGKEQLLEHAWDLMLSGHTHGGQARVPGMNSFWAPVRDKRFLEGLHEWEGRRLFISRGLGSPKHVRLNCPPEISILHLG
jgi:predicted MPP superfamily phosphohydrolase